MARGDTADRAGDQTGDRVAAVVARTGGAIREALARQERAPHTVVPAQPSLREAPTRAVEGGADWIWLLDGIAIPRPDALAALITALGNVPNRDETALLAGVVRDRDGAVEAARAFWFRSDAVEPAMAVAQAGLLPVRAASGPVLVRADAAIDRPPPPDAELSTRTLFPWTARLLAASQGYLVATSEHDATEPVPDPLAAPGVVARLIMGDSFGRIDRLRLVSELAGRLRA